MILQNTFPGLLNIYNLIYYNFRVQDLIIIWYRYMEYVFLPSPSSQEMLISKM
jgi:hypothetical protein